MKLPRFSIPRQIIPVLLGIFTLLLLGPSIVKAAPLDWTKSSGIDSYSQELRIAPSNSSIVFATLRNGASSGLFKSTNGGLSFTNVFPLVWGRDVNSIAISYSNPDRLCIGTYELGVFCSIDGGLNFSNAGWRNSNIQTVVRFVTIDPSNDNIFYVGTGYNNSDGGIYKTTDGGVSWARVGTSTYGGLNTLNIIVDRLDQNKVFAGSDSFLYRSYDGGNNWTALHVNNTNSPATIVDNVDSSIVYTASHPFGIYKSINNGDTWIPKNTNIEHTFIFRLSQDNNGSLYGSQISSPGVWRSKDGAETWENIADPAWATASGNTWGLDVRNGRILVSVEGLGIYAANTDGSSINSPPEPNPVIFVPGLGGSWSHKGLIENNATTYADWQLMPVFTDEYKALLSTFKNAGLTEGKNLFTFAYDWRQPVSASGSWLNDFIKTEVLPKNPGRKINVIGHSLGGLVGRSCIETFAECKSNVNKFISAGSPHRGAVEAYYLWAGGEITEKNLLRRVLENILIRVNSKSFAHPKDIIQHLAPSIRDILPNFDYITGRPYSAMTAINKNPFLDGLGTANMLGFLTAFSGNTKPTPRNLTVTPPNRFESALGLWLDGKPAEKQFAVGDYTVLAESAQVPGATNKVFDTYHGGLVGDLLPQQEILTDFGLNGLIVTTNKISSRGLAFLLHSPATVTVYDSSHNVVGEKLGGQTVLIEDPISDNYIVQLDGTGQGHYDLDVGSFNSDTHNWQKISGQTQPGKRDSFIFHYDQISPLNGNVVDPDGKLSLQMARLELITHLSHDTDDFSHEIDKISAKIAKKQYRPAAGEIEELYRDIIEQIAEAKAPNVRGNLKDIAFYLSRTYDQIIKAGGINIDQKKLARSLTRAEKMLTSYENGKHDDEDHKSALFALNFLTARDYLGEAKGFYAGNYYPQAYLASAGIPHLLNQDDD